MTPAVLAEGLFQRFGSAAVLGPLDLEIDLGQRIAITGDNGAGKTTLLRMIATAARPAGGRLEVLGIDAITNREDVRHRIGFVGHQLGLYPRLTALENLELFCALYGLPESRASTLLALVGLAGRSRELAERLSRGMQQRVALARSLLHDPELWVLDEPEASLDGAGRVLLGELMGTRTVLIATHQREVVEALCTGEIRLEAGRRTGAPLFEVVRGSGG